MIFHSPWEEPSSGLINTTLRPGITAENTINALGKPADDTVLLKRPLHVLATGRIVLTKTIEMNGLGPETMIRRKEFLIKPNKPDKKVPGDMPDEDK